MDAPATKLCWRNDEAVVRKRNIPRRRDRISSLRAWNTIRRPEGFEFDHRGTPGFRAFTPVLRSHIAVNPKVVEKRAHKPIEIESARRV